MSYSSEHYLPGWTHGRDWEQGTFAVNYVLYPKHEKKELTQMALRQKPIWLSR
jgi:hypothetical protein